MKLMHKLGNSTLGRRSWSLRKAMIRNMLTSLVLHSRVETTLQKGRALVKAADRLVALARRSLEARARGDVGKAMRCYRAANRVVMPTDDFVTGPEKEAMRVLFEVHAKRYLNMNKEHGGFTRLVRTRKRTGDAADMAYVEFVARPGELRPAAGCIDSVLEWRKHEYLEEPNIDTAPLFVRQVAHQTLPPEWRKPQLDITRPLKERRLQMNGLALERWRRRISWLEDEKQRMKSDGEGGGGGGSGGGDVDAAKQVREWRHANTLAMQRVLWGA